MAVAIGLGLLAPLAVLAQTPAGAVVRAVSVQRTVEARRAGRMPLQAVQLNDKVSPGDTIRVSQRSRADIALLDQSVLRRNANTEVTVESVKDESTGVVSLLRGAPHFFSRGLRSVEVQTPFTVAGSSRNSVPHGAGGERGTVDDIRTHGVTPNRITL